MSAKLENSQAGCDLRAGGVAAIRTETRKIPTTKLSAVAQRIESASVLIHGTSARGGARRRSSLIEQPQAEDRAL
jgi:hypothetical protein